MGHGRLSWRCYLSVKVTHATHAGPSPGQTPDAGFFFDEVARRGAEGCSCLLAVDVGMNTIDGYRMSSWDRRYRDFAMQPDLGTFRRVSSHQGTALVLADRHWENGSAV